MRVNDKNIEEGNGERGREFTGESERKERKIWCAFICEMRYLSSDDVKHL